MDFSANVFMHNVVILNMEIILINIVGSILYGSNSNRVFAFASIHTI